MQMCLAVCAAFDACSAACCVNLAGTVPVFFGNELEDGVLCAAPDRIMVLFGLFNILRTLADRRQLHQIADRLWGRFSLKWPFSFDTCGRPHLPPETNLAAGGVPVCWLLLVLPVDETCELLILVLEHHGAKRCCRASISADAGLIYLWLCAAWGYWSMGSCSVLKLGLLEVDGLSLAAGAVNVEACSVTKEDTKSSTVQHQAVLPQTTPAQNTGGATGPSFSIGPTCNIPENSDQYWSQNKHSLVSKPAQCIKSTDSNRSQQYSIQANLEGSREVAQLREQLANNPTPSSHCTSQILQLAGSNEQQNCTNRQHLSSATSGGSRKPAKIGNEAHQTAHHHTSPQDKSAHQTLWTNKTLPRTKTTQHSTIWAER
ncbi:hypothetical protein Nepgr_026616 [Nepenthes gracilis]|uniref:Uncharacterized protein n=1 Tax=Nepenthes gracilis TaxID=150966 RepID=A0AAD3T8E6_NEPGR|nr:hypothetical protein Nepgr_026616 [Nepenthes gracilis]